MNPHTNSEYPLVENCAGIESREESVILASLKRIVGLMDGCPLELAQSPEDLEAIAWIRQSLEDLEATIIGLCHSTLPSSLDDGQTQPSPGSSLMS